MFSSNLKRRKRMMILRAYPDARKRTEAVGYKRHRSIAVRYQQRKRSSRVNPRLAVERPMV